MAIRYCPKCKENVVTKVLSAKCGMCKAITSPLDKTLKVPVDRAIHDVYVRRRQYRN